MPSNWLIESRGACRIAVLQRRLQCLVANSRCGHCKNGRDLDDVSITCTDLDHENLLMQLKRDINGLMEMGWEGRRPEERGEQEGRRPENRGFVSE